MIFNFLARCFGRHAAPAIPDTLWLETLAALPFLARLDEDERARLRQITEAFLAEKEFSSAGGLELTDAMCVSIAVQGCLPILNIGLDAYRNWVGIIVYPDEFVIPRTIEDEFGVVHEYEEVASGEAWDGGPLLISWQDAQLAGDGYNVVIHEFAHKLDMLTGEADGTPPLPSGTSHETWARVLNAAYDDFCAWIDETVAGGDPDCESLPLDPYAAESPAEFFAVMSEAFFETPAILHERYPDFFAQLAAFYRQTPLPLAQRKAPPSSALT